LVIPEALSVRRVFLDGGKLMVDRGRGVTSELVPTSERSFLMLGAPEKVEITFFREKSGALQILIAAADEKPILADRVDPTIAADLKQYEGSFWSSDVGEIVTLAAREGKLWLQTKRNVEFELHPVAADIFKNEWFGKLTFHRNKQSSVTAFTMSNGEVRKLDLTKVNVRFDPVE
jgi:uncharacterized protein DUF3471